MSHTPTRQAVSRPSRLSVEHRADVVMPHWCRAIAAEHEGRIEAHGARVAAEEAPGDKATACWGGCGRTVGRGRRPRQHGWFIRTVVISGMEQREILCPACFHAHGYIEPTEDGMAKGREAVQEQQDTAKYLRLTDRHIVTECEDCASVLLSLKHAEEVMECPDGLPPLVAGSVRLANGRTVKFCARCFTPREPRQRGMHTAGGGDRKVPDEPCDAEDTEEA